MANIESSAPGEEAAFLFPDMPVSAPVSERARIESESKQFADAVASKGPLLIPSMAARVVGISQQRISTLLEEGKLSALHFFGHRWIYLQELQERQERPKSKGGRPKQVA